MTFDIRKVLYIFNVLQKPSLNFGGGIAVTLLLFPLICKKKNYSYMHVLTEKLYPKIK